MLTHFHLLLEMEDPRKISRFMAGLDRMYTHYHHKVHGTSGFLWQGRFGLQPIQKEPYLIACGRYIERNPVRANVVPAAHEYQFSSAGFYCKGALDGITDEDPTFAGFGAEPVQRRARYTRFLSDFNEEEEKLFKNNHLPAGDDNFKRRLQLINGRYLPKEVRRCAQHAVAQRIKNLLAPEGRVRM
jgi:putative transposase